jgi:histidine triad (HIT) family protein
MSNCIFCQFEEQIDSVIYQTENFFVKIGIAIVTAGHVMIIPKKHVLAIGEIEDNLVEEYIDLKNYTVDLVAKRFAEPFLIEYGNFGQSVFHAHIHVIPRSGNNYKNADFFNDVMLPFCEENNTVLFKINKFKQLQDYYKEYKKYTYFEDENGRYILQLKEDMKETPSYRKYFTEKFKVEGCKSWKDMTEKDKQGDEIKYKKTKEKLIFDI